MDVGRRLGVLELLRRRSAVPMEGSDRMGFFRRYGGAREIDTTPTRDTAGVSMQEIRNALSGAGGGLSLNDQRAMRAIERQLAASTAAGYSFRQGGWAGNRPGGPSLDRSQVLRIEALLARSGAAGRAR
jgi:hypothetical protein